MIGVRRGIVHMYVYISSKVNSFLLYNVCSCVSNSIAQMSRIQQLVIFMDALDQLDT